MIRDDQKGWDHQRGAEREMILKTGAKLIKAASEALAGSSMDDLTAPGRVDT